MKNFSNPVKIGVIILLIGIAIMAYGTYLNNENISYYALLIIITGLFIYMAYTFNFVSKSNVNYSNKEKEKKKKKWYIIKPYGTLGLSRETYFLDVVFLFFLTI